MSDYDGKTVGQQHHRHITDDIMQSSIQGLKNGKFYSTFSEPLMNQSVAAAMQGAACQLHWE